MKNVNKIKECITNIKSFEFDCGKKNILKLSFVSRVMRNDF